MDDIRFDNKRYFISYCYMSPRTYLNQGEEYNNLKGISQFSPVQISAGKPVKILFEIGDDFNHPKIKENPPVFTAYADTTDFNGERLIIKINGCKLKKIETYGHRRKWLTRFMIPLEIMKPGVNEVEVEVLPADRKAERELLIMSGKELLKGKKQAPWRRLFNVHDYDNSEEIVNDAYRITDSGMKTNEYANLLYPLGGISSEEITVRFQAKVETSNSILSNVVRIANGQNVEIVTLEPDRIGLYHIGKFIKFNTTDSFHDYQVCMKNGKIILTVDGKELLNEKLKMKADDPAGFLKDYAYSIANMHRRSLLWGSLSGTGKGSSLWKQMRIVGSNNEVFLKDLKFELIFPDRKKQNCNEKLYDNSKKAG